MLKKEVYSTHMATLCIVLEREKLFLKTFLQYGSVVTPESAEGTELGVIVGLYESDKFIGRFLSFILL